MTKVRAHFTLNATPDEKLFERIDHAQALYGVEWIKLSPAMTTIDVEYDATRFSPADLEAALHRCGLAIERTSVTPNS